ncbi:iron-containing alcohol dehydrogenase [Endozoicomonas sp.]|uniref:iron-containing alcohol dehydrogenase n=1 Tax=Endozoicomonas sp. TaxID=1892382 RepID=UPI0028847180|nr:iron-containing alcohol dehydrogenase [Endozoicomonas sp.]
MTGKVPVIYQLSLHSNSYPDIECLALQHNPAFNAIASPERFVDIAKAMGVDTTGMNQEQAIDAGIQAIADLSTKVGTAQRLGELGVKEDKLAFMAQNALNNACSLTNLRKASLEEIVAIYRSCL